MKSVTLTHKGNNFTLYISPKNGFIDNHIFLYGVYEPHILDAISSHLKHGMTFIDIGANIGQHSMYAATVVGEQGKVYSYEPIPAIYEQLQKSNKANKYEAIITAHNIALGEKESVATLNVSKNIGGSSLVNQEDEIKDYIQVTIKNGDKELLLLPRIDMVKIDVEGYEYEVLSGMQATLATHHPTILLEFSGDFYHKHTKGHGYKLLSLLKNEHYELYDIEDAMRLITNLELFDKEISLKRVQTNLLCLYTK